MSAGSALAPDAAMALGIASTAMPFARTPEDEAERWLRVLRMHGEAGIALQALGVSEGPLETPDIGEEALHPPDGSERSGSSARTTPAEAGDRDAVVQVTEQAVDLANRRGANGVGTRDLLVAVMRIYGDDFDRVLRAHGADREEVLEALDSAHRSTAHGSDPEP